MSALAHAAGAAVIVDNVFATPLLQSPLQLGADIVVYSATKHIDGQGRCLGGAVLSSRDFIDNQLMPFMRHTGPALSPFNAWVLVKGLETLSLRVEKMCANALAVAEHLQTLPGVARVIYPGLDCFPQKALAEAQMKGGGTIVAFELAGGKPAAFTCLDSLRLVDISNNLGDSKSLITHPQTTTHRAISEDERQQIGVTPGLARLSVGLEGIEDLKADFTQALSRSASVDVRSVA